MTTKNKAAPGENRHGLRNASDHGTDDNAIAQKTSKPILSKYQAKQLRRLYEAASDSQIVAAFQRAGMLGGAA